MKLKVGVIGAGYISSGLHLPVFKSLNGVEVTTLCDRNKRLAQDVAIQFNIGRIFSDAKEMFEEGELDLVDICTPPSTHAKLAIQGMEAGCHILVEKPMAISSSAAMEMVNVSTSCDKKIGVIHQNLYNSAVLKARQLVESHAIGELLSVQVHTFENKESELCTNEHHWCHQLLGGMFFEILPHPIYLLRSFLKNARVLNVSAKKLGQLPWLKKDELLVSCEGENALGFIHTSCNSMIHGDILRLIGTRSSLEVDLWGRTLVTSRPHTKSPTSVGLSNLHLSMQLFKVLGSTALTMARSMMSAVKVKAHYRFISEFVQSIQGKTNPPTTGADGLENVKFLERICSQI